MLSVYKNIPIRGSCRFKEYTSNCPISELVSEEEASKIRDQLTQAKASELAARQEGKPETQSTTEEEFEPEASTAVKTEREGAGEAVAMEVDDISAVVEQQGTGAEPTEVRREAAQMDDGEAAEAPQQAVDNVIKAEHTQQVKAEPELKEENATGRADISDEDVKAYWLSGIAALYQVIHL